MIFLSLGGDGWSLQMANSLGRMGKTVYAGVWRSEYRLAKWGSRAAEVGEAGEQQVNVHDCCDLQLSNANLGFDLTDVREPSRDGLGRLSSRGRFCGRAGYFLMGART